MTAVDTNAAEFHAALDFTPCPGRPDRLVLKASDAAAEGRKTGSIRSMQTGRIKISVSLPRDLVARIDRAARAEARSRSRVLEGWLRAAARENTAQELEQATIAYYQAMTSEDRGEDEGIAAASSRVARRLRVDSPDSRSPRRRKK